MVFEHIEKLKQEYTDKYVAIANMVPELKRFEGRTGIVRTVNMSGRALVEFLGTNDISWYDIDVDFLKIVPPPVPADEKKTVEKGTASKPSSAKATAQKKPSASTADILAMESPGDALPFLKGAWHYAQGEAYAKTGNLVSAMGEVEEISALIGEADLSPLTGNGIPAIDILNIARLTIIARVSAAEGKFDTAIEAMEEAVDLQEGLAYTEPPYWYYPSKQTLASMLLQAGKTERAEQMFLESLTYSPNNAWVLFGLSETYKAQGDKNAAKYANALFKDAWIGGKKSYPGIADL